ncbi:MAG: hypothetical protein H7274_15810, partial [Rhodoferax sp.]|nr:hypothetical protein [Rhodoferax sp.]
RAHPETPTKIIAAMPMESSFFMFNPYALKKPDLEERSIAPADSDAPGSMRSLNKYGDQFSTAQWMLFGLDARLRATPYTSSK